MTPQTKQKGSVIFSQFAQQYLFTLIFIAVFAVAGTFTLLLTRAASSGGQISGIAGLCLDNNQNQTIKGNKVQLWQCNGSSAQRWIIATPSGPGTIANANGYCLDARNAGIKVGTIVQLWPCNGTPAQLWMIHSNGSITNANPHASPNLCLDDKYGNTSNGNQIWLWSCNGTPAQVWNVTQAMPSSQQSSPTASTPAASPAKPQPTEPSPLGVSGNWKLAFADEFTQDTMINQQTWSQTSAAESECGQGNHGNGQAEWNQGYANDTLEGATGLSITDIRQTVSHCSDTFSWTGGLLATKQSFTPGDVIEEKFQFPAGVPVGGWPSLWTWCANGANGCEVDAYEAWPPNSNGNGTVTSTDHVGGNTTGSASTYVSVGDWHTMDAVIGDHSVTWYLDGKLFGSATHATAEQAFNVIIDNDVCSGTTCPAPLKSTSKIVEKVAYVRVWQPR